LFLIEKNVFIVYKLMMKKCQEINEWFSKQECLEI
jgi:hypothetical protein